MISTQDWTSNAQGSEGLINFSQLFEFKCEQREDLVRGMNKTAMGIRISSSLVKKNQTQEHS
jgi:hypothetical protein